MSLRVIDAWKRAAGILLLSASIAAASTLDAGATAEVDYLIARVGTSGCRFYRNGTWYDAQRAEAHLREKYQMLRDLGAIGSTDEFIEKAATRSSISGRDYAIQCDDAAVEPSAQWLHEELRKYRDGIRPSAPPARSSAHRPSHLQ